jgi:hypothetical protein
LRAFLVAPPKPRARDKNRSAVSQTFFASKIFDVGQPISLGAALGLLLTTARSLDCLVADTGGRRGTRLAPLLS